MDWWIFPSQLGTLVGLIAAFYGYRYVRRPANAYLSLLGLASAWICATQWAGLLVPNDRAYRYVIVQLQQLGSVSGPVLWMLVALAYCGYERILNIARFALWILPVITLLLVFTNQWHGLAWRKFELIPGSPGIQLTYGPWYAIEATYAYGLVVLGTGLLVHRFARSPSYILQLLTVLAAPLTVLGSHLSYLAGMNPFPVNPTPLGLAAASLMMALAIRRRLFSVVPVTHQDILDSLSEGVIVADKAGRIADSNRAARDLLDVRGNIVGKPLEHWLPEACNPSSSDYDVGRPNGRCLNIRNTDISDPGGESQGKVITLRDVTDERAARERLMEVQKELEKANAELNDMAHTDSLTGLVNRRGLQGAMKTEWSRSTRHCRNLSFILMDFDHFKEINDTYGHLAGDRVLEQTGRALRETTRPEDIVARYGGEEFAILLPETDLHKAVILARRLHKVVSQLRFAHPTLGSFQVTTSIGIANRIPNDHSARSLVSRADAALYHSKNQGRNSISIADEHGCHPVEMPAPAIP